MLAIGILLNAAAPLLLSEDQILTLIAIPTPDPAIAKEIRRRGVAFGVTDAILVNFRERGAGRATLAALRELMRTSGTLHLTVNRAGADVVVMSMHGEIKVAESTLVARSLDLPLAPNRYRALIGCRFCSQTEIQFAIEAGRVTTVAADLEVDADKILSEGRSALLKGSPREALELAASLLNEAPQDAGALSLAAQASFDLSDFESFEGLAQRAIAQGGKISIPLKHVHDLPLRAHDMQLIVSTAAISIEDVSGRRERPFSAPTADWTVNALREKAGGVCLFLSARSGRGSPQSFVLADSAAKVVVGPKTARVESVVELNWVGRTLEASPQARDSLQAIASVVQGAVRQAALGTLTTAPGPTASSSEAMPSPADEGLAAATPSATTRGIWTGRVNQPGFGDYPVLIDLDELYSLEPGTLAGRIEYPTIECSGTLRLVSRPHDGRALLRETVDGRCEDGYIRLLWTGAGTVRAAWSDFKGRERAEATLTESDPH